MKKKPAIHTCRRHKNPKTYCMSPDQWYCSKCTAERAANRYRYLTRLADPEKKAAAKAKWRKNAATYKQKHPDRIKLYQQRTRYVRKMRVLKHYGGDKPTCACCNEAAWQFLSIDHTSGGGAKHRRQITEEAGTSSSGNHIYAWLIKNNFPDGFRVLCMNCNFALGQYGYCPHHPGDAIDISRTRTDLRRPQPQRS